MTWLRFEPATTKLLNERLRVLPRQYMLLQTKIVQGQLTLNNCNQKLGVSIGKQFGGDHTNPTCASEDASQTDVFSILQLNCRGISNKYDEILNYMHTNNIKVAVIQETKLSSRSNLTDKDGYNFVRCDRTRDEGGGLTFMVHNTLAFQLQIYPDHFLRHF